MPNAFVQLLEAMAMQEVLNCQRKFVSLRQINFLRIF